MHSVAEELQLLFASSYPLVYLISHEEDRARRLVMEAAKALQRKVGIWISTGGTKAGEESRDPIKLLNTLKGHAQEAGVTLLLDFHVFLREPEVVRRLRDLVPVLQKTSHSLVVLSPVVVMPPELEKDIVLMDLPMPERADLELCLHQVCDEEGLAYPEDRLDALMRASRGLTENEARRAFVKSLRRQGEFNDLALALILEEKKQAIRKSEVLEFFELEENLEGVGGLEEVKRWLHHRSRAFDEAAARYGLPAPKGLLLLGVQGCGKSLTAKAVAGSFRLALVRLDLAAVFGSTSPESAMRKAIQLVESLAPVILWVDEIEKGFSEVNGAGGNSSTRVFGSFITWLQEKKAPVFVVATANEVEHLPPELLRKGRFDEIFFVDLPDIHERKAILSIHLTKRGRVPNAFDLNTLARQTQHFTGSELEQGILAGMYRSFAEDREVDSHDIGSELDAIVPLYTTYEEKIKALREWAKTRARRANVDQSLVDLFEQE